MACCTFLLVGVAAAADDHGEAKPTTSRSLTATPQLTGFLPAPLRSHLRIAFRLAQERIRNRRACAALFTRLGADGLQLLARARFASAAIEKDRRACAGRVAARTEVSGREIRLCPAFVTLSPRDAAPLLIHEVLHHAGLSERPPDPNGLTPQEINDLVGASCGR